MATLIIVRVVSQNHVQGYKVAMMAEWHVRQISDNFPPPQFTPPVPPPLFPHLQSMAHSVIAHTNILTSLCSSALTE